MKHVEYWLADDGTRFEDEDECKSYEMMPPNDVVDGLKLLDRYLCEMTLKSDEFWGTFADRIMYVKISNQAALDWLKKLSEFTGVSLPGKIGTFFYDPKYDRWICTEDLLDNLAVIRRKLTE